MYTLWLISATWVASAPQQQPLPYGAAAYPRPQASSPYHVMSYPPSVASTPVPASPVPSPTLGFQPVTIQEQAEAPPTVQMAPEQPAQPLAQISAPQPPREQPLPPPAQRLVTSLPEGDRSKVGHEHDYSWITGYLYYVHSHGGRWVLRYAALDQLDRYGGSVVLAPTVEMRSYREGDLVTVRGEVLQDSRALPDLGGPFYRAQIIEMVERRE
jgi:hypothetical protein